MTGALDGRTVVVAGASRGIGRAIAHACAAQGARLVLVARTASDLEAVAGECRQRGAPAARGVLADVTDWSAVRRMVDCVLAEEGTIDALVVSSGIYGPIAPVAELDVAEWTEALQVNLVGPLYLLRAVLPHMVERRSGKVILLAGGGATQAMAGFSSYGAAKAGLVRLAETAALEVRAAGVQVNAIAPGLVDTGLQDAVLAARDAAGAVGDRIARARETGEGAVSPDVAAALAAFLASDDSGEITGKLIAAPHDDWRDWPGRADTLNVSDWYTLRRLDPHTIRRLPPERQ